MILCKQCTQSRLVTLASPVSPFVPSCRFCLPLCFCLLLCFATTHLTHALAPSRSLFPLSPPFASLPPPLSLFSWLHIVSSFPLVFSFTAATIARTRSCSFTLFIADISLRRVRVLPTKPTPSKQSKLSHRPARVDGSWIFSTLEIWMRRKWMWRRHM